MIASIAINTCHFARGRRSKEFQESSEEMHGNTGYRAKDNEGDLVKGRTKALVTQLGSDSKINLQIVEGMHAVPPPMTGNYMPSGPDREVDDSMFTYGPKQSKTSKSVTQTSNYDSCESNSSTETLESMPEPKVDLNKAYLADISRTYNGGPVAFGGQNNKTASTPIKTQKPLTKDEEAADVDVHLYRSMISSLMYLTASRPDIMFAVCACSRFQVTPKTSHLNAVKRIFRYLKGKPKLGLWYPRVSSFDMDTYSDSDYAGANLDRKSTTEEGEYVAAANCCRQVLWIQNQMLDYGFNFMNTKIYIDNESTICIVKNTVFHSKTKHIEIRHHFIRDAYENELIQVLKIHTDDNVADLLTKAFDVSRRLSMIAKKKSKRQKPDSDLEREETTKSVLMISPDEEGELIMSSKQESSDETFETIKLQNGFDPNSLVYILVLEDGTEFYMLAERRYPLTKETLKRMLALRLIAESESKAVFDLLRFIQHQINESGSHDGSEKDL
ncbi:hypothetical protein Tco_0012578 [Tanacetum coccineum]